MKKRRFECLRAVDDDPYQYHSPPKLLRTYKASCPLKCRHGITVSYDPLVREVLHEQCQKSVLRLQRCWRKKYRLRKYQEVSKSLSNYVPQTMGVRELMQIISSFWIGEEIVH